jgi:anaerobic C4-dicarboxylate transporter
LHQIRKIEGNPLMKLSARLEIADFNRMHLRVSASTILKIGSNVRAQVAFPSQKELSKDPKLQKRLNHPQSHQRQWSMMIVIATTIFLHVTRLTTRRKPRFF